MINDLIRGFSLAIAAGVGITAAVITFRWWRDNRKPGCHCWACRRLDKTEGAQRDPQLTAELTYHLYLWETGPTVEPDRERS